MKNKTQKKPLQPNLKDGAFRRQVDGSLVSKIEAYGWKVKDSPGEFQYIDKNDLNIAHEYQREIKKKIMVLEVAREWSWISCGCLIVCLRDGKYWVVDGQHRHAAAMKRSDITKLPCLIFPSDCVREEASAFLTSNQRRTRVSSHDTYRALVAAQDENALFVTDFIKKAGLKVGLSGSAKTVACIGTLMRLAKDDRQNFVLIWPLIHSMHHDCEIYGDVVKGCWTAESMLLGRGKSLLKEPNFSKLIRIGGKASLAEIKRLSIERGKGGTAVFRDAILALLKKKI